MNGNALITSIHLGYEDHGILTCWLHLSQEGAGQRFGGCSLKENASFWIKRILNTVGVDKWEDLKHKYIRVKGEPHGDIFGIGHITDNKWFFPKEELNKKGE